MIAKILKPKAITKKQRQYSVELEDGNIVTNETHPFTDKTSRVVFIPEGTLVTFNFAVHHKMNRAKAIEDRYHEGKMRLIEDVVIPFELLFGSGAYIPGTRIRLDFTEEQSVHYDNILKLSTCDENHDEEESEDPFELDSDGAVIDGFESERANEELESLMDQQREAVFEEMVELNQISGLYDQEESNG